MSVYVKKCLNLFFWLLDKICKKAFLRWYPKYLRWLGVQIDKNNTGWISPTCFFDSSKYEYIKIGNDVVISFDVTILVHDYSIVNAGRAIDKKTDTIIYKRVEIGNNVFIGAKTIILPGSRIGDNCIIGAGSVIKGKIESNSIYVGNPARKIGDVEDFAHKYMYCFRE